MGKEAHTITTRRLTRTLDVCREGVVQIVLICLMRSIGYALPVKLIVCIWRIAVDKGSPNDILIDETLPPR